MWFSGSAHCVASVSPDGRPNSDLLLVERVPPIHVPKHPDSQSMLLAGWPVELTR
jgi:hypothetical protein